MSLTRHLRPLTTRRPAKRARPSPAQRMWLELLEDRMLPSTLTVTSLLAGGPGSLRAEIAAAAAGDTIVLDSSLSGQIMLTSGELDITQNLTIQGPGAATLTVSGNNAQRVFHILPSVSATISGLTIANGSVPDFGAGIESEGSLTLLDSTLTNNSAGQGGGGVSFVVSNTGAASLTVSGSTFTNNTAPDGAGVFSSVTNRSGLVAVAVSVARLTPLKRTRPVNLSITHKSRTRRQVFRIPLRSHGRLFSGRANGMGAPTWTSGWSGSWVGRSSRICD